MMTGRELRASRAFLGIDQHKLAEMSGWSAIRVICMQLTKFSDYSLRVLMYTHAAGGRRVTIQEIAAAYRISRPHLMKVVNWLARAGYLTALRGRSGGLVLARPAEDIRLGEVVRATEPAFAIVECFSTNNQCVFSDYCRLPRVFDKALTAFLTVLDQHTLASVAMRSKDFRTVFQTTRQPIATKRKWYRHSTMSAYGGKAEIARTYPDVRS
jgi:Rrf2 family transcriptional regulator, nitric oxide-sensitive transcriptional repressor